MTNKRTTSKRTTSKRDPRVDEFIEKVAQQSRARAGAPSEVHWSPSDPVSTESVGRAVGYALMARRQGRLLAFDLQIDLLLTMSGRAESLVSQHLVTVGSQALDHLWIGGWQPADVVAVIAKTLTTTHGEVAASAIAQEHLRQADRPLHPQWVEQLEQLGRWWTDRVEHSTRWLSVLSTDRGMDLRSAIEQLVELLSVVSQLPRLPVLLPPPGPGADRVSPRRAASSDPVDTKVLAKVRGLLAKAESTEFPEEAESLTVKAQELITRHAIDDAMLTAGAADHQGAQGVRIHLLAPYADAKAALAHAVASANRCQAVFDSSLGFVTLFGFPGDLAVVDLLFTSLLSQATSAMVAAGKVLDRAGTSRTKSFRHSFLIAYAARIGQRLKESAHASVEQAEQELGVDLLPVLASRDEAVAQRVAEVFPKLRTKSTRVGSAAGWEAGRQAADRAQLGTWAQVTARRS